MVPSVSQTVVLFRVRHAGYSHVMWQHAAACCCLFFFTTRSRDCSRACAWPTTKLLSLPLSLAGSLLPQVLPHSLSHFSRLTWRKDGRTTTIESAPTDRPNGFVQSTNGRAPEEGRKERACAGCCCCWLLGVKKQGGRSLGLGLRFSCALTPSFSPATSRWLSQQDGCKSSFSFSRTPFFHVSLSFSHVLVLRSVYRRRRRSSRQQRSQLAFSLHPPTCQAVQSRLCRR
jgi:hypothetical protein